MILVISVLVVGLLSADAALFAGQVPTSPPVLSDPAVDAYTAFVKGTNLNHVPVDRPFVVGAIDRLLSAIEGLVLTETPDNDAVFARIRRVRRTLRSLAASSSHSPEVTGERRDIFRDTAKLIAAIDAELPPGRRPPPEMIDAIHRAANGLDFDDPLPNQPNAIQHFLDLSAAALAHMNH